MTIVAKCASQWQVSILCGFGQCKGVYMGGSTLLEHSQFEEMLAFTSFHLPGHVQFIDVYLYALASFQQGAKVSLGSFTQREERG